MKTLTLVAQILTAAGFMTVQACQGSSLVIHCPLESVINIQSAFYGRKTDDICPHPEESGGAAAQYSLSNSTQKHLKKGFR